MFKIFLDDIRNPPIGFDGKVCRTANEAIELLKTGNISEISFDHDLGLDKTGYDVASFIEEEVYFKRMNCPKWNIHSDNPVGTKNIKNAMMNAEKFQNENHI